MCCRSGHTDGRVISQQKLLTNQRGSDLQIASFDDRRR